ncbi:sensor histidine kinase N-terminal domain-containing protein [Roseinatronobacter alkalisoli]|uniref:Sensor histidine kinase N-terminal domain-containing protein n=1 Tax=Roseinatronobacter alkalisoli TaxID=3028235 RepID=A0ABT5TEZ1_9RHOB|nr:sensor histidine kinase N-terminal domain-containing protein [Roseinatronobacter sp. HJB301]MDD7973693.1 sensor histidine kinase N-terminal domain-containing protein [Roseinatronobacter sp. HJB301]
MLFLIIRQNAIEAAEEAFDRVLGAAALSIADTVQYENGNVIVDIPYSSFAILGMSRLNRVFYRVVAPNGEIITGSPILGLEIPHATGPELRVALPSCLCGMTWVDGDRCKCHRPCRA